jgi:hypothetical protein
LTPQASISDVIDTLEKVSCGLLTQQSCISDVNESKLWPLMQQASIGDVIDTLEKESHGLLTQQACVSDVIDTL